MSNRARSYQFGRSLPTLDAAPANKPAQGRPTAPEPVNKFCWQPRRKSPRSSARERGFEETSRTKPQRNRRHRVRHLADPDHGQLLIAWCWQMDLFRDDVECTSHLFATVTFTSAHTALMSSTLAAFWLRKQQQQLSYVGAGQTVGSGHTRATSTSASTAYPSCPVVSKHERKRHHPRGDGRMTRLGLSTSQLARWPGPSDADFQLSPTQPIARRSETAPVVRVKSPPPCGSTSTVA